jgi:hypothetical protein
MRRTTLSLLVITGLTLAPVAGIAATDKQRVRELEKRLAAQEQRLQALEGLLQKSQDDAKARDAAVQQTIAEDHRQVASLQGDVGSLKAHEQTQVTRLTMPRPKSWEVGLEGRFLDIHGGEAVVAQGTVVPAGQGGIFQLVDPTLRSESAERVALYGKVRYNDTPGDSYQLSYSTFGVQTPFGPFAAAGGDPISGGTFFTVVAGAFPLQVTDVVASRTVDFHDLRLDRESVFATSEKNAWSFLWGVRHVDYDDDLAINALNRGATTPLPVPSTTLVSSQQSSFQGTGPTVGVKSRRFLGRRFEWENRATGSLLVGRVRTQINAFSTALGTATPIINTSATANGLFPGIDLVSNLVYHASDNLDLNVGYEASRIFDANAQSVSFFSFNNDLDLDGVRAGATWEFN